METRGRKTVMTPEIIGKLEQVFAVDGTDEEACGYADIAEATLYNYQKEHPEFIERKRALKDKQVLKARQTVSRTIEESYANAMDYLKRKRKAEFGDTHGLDITTKGKSLYIDPTDPKVVEALKLLDETS